jgi:hypothetical protein
MKPYLIVVIACSLPVACYSKATQAIKVVKTGLQPEVVSNMETDQTSGEDITGYWKLKLEARDDNGNKILDETERKKGFKNRYSFRFNADGSCQIVESYKGRYEVKTEGGNKMLYVYRKRVEGVEKQDPPPDVYRIISTSKNELVLLEDLGNLVFWVFERAS